VKLLGIAVYFLIRLRRRVLMWVLRPLFRKCGSNVVFGHGGDFSFENIEIGDDVYIGPHASFMGIRPIRIGSKVMFGPRVMLLGGDHRTDVVGAYMFDVKEKLPSNDAAIVIEDDVWIGSDVLILKGVTIGRGSVIGAGSVVTRSVPPYSVYVGSAPVRMRDRWDAATIAEHERKLAARQ
jgi:acetyltransferase-like isoleucine patch superfamily enzyme